LDTPAVGSLQVAIPPAGFPGSSRSRV